MPMAMAMAVAMTSSDNKPASAFASASGTASPPHPRSSPHSSEADPEVEELRETNTNPNTNANKIPQINGNGNGKGRRSREGTPPSSAASPSPSAMTTINLSREYLRTIQTPSFQEMWVRIHGSAHAHAHAEVEAEEGEEEEGPTIAHVLQPDRASVEEILDAVPATRMTRLIRSYMESSEQTSLLCLSLQGSVDQTRTIYDPIAELLELIPVCATSITPALCNKAFDTFIQFDTIRNPFPSSSSSSSSSSDAPPPATQFQSMRTSFRQLKHQLDDRLHKARRKRQLLRRTARVSGVCLIACTASITVTGLVLASHILGALVVGSACILGGSCCDLVALHGLREDMDRLDAAARNTYVLNNDLDTIERLLARLHDTIEDDKKLVRLGVEGGRGQRHPIEHVVRHLRKNHHSLLQQLSDLDEHICLYFASVNRVRSLLLQHIHQPNS